MVNEYTHTETTQERIARGKPPFCLGTSSSTKFEITPIYKERKLLVLQCLMPNNNLYVVVPGYIERERFKKTPQGLDISEVTEVPKSDKKDITDFLRKMGLSGNVNFWRIR